MKPAGDRIASPHDTDATFGAKRGDSWLGYKVHLTETFGDRAPHLITNVQTTPAHVHDADVLKSIHASLQSRGRKPKVHLVDSGYVNFAVLQNSLAVHGIDVLTRLPADTSRQARERKGFDAASFYIDWNKKEAICPSGVSSQHWKPRNEDVINISFPEESCRICPFKTDCTSAASRKLQIKTRSVYKFTVNHRKRQESREFNEEYSKRAGIEGTLSEAVRRANLRQSHFKGIAKTHMEKLLQAAGLNLFRLGRWIMNIGLAKTRIGKFERLVVSA